MNIRNKYIIAFILIISYLNINNVQAQQPDHTFSYQGELIDNGVPANGSYDIIVDAFSLETGGANLGSTSQHLGVVVQNGLFNLTNVNVGEVPYDGFQVWLQIAVRPAVGGGGFTALSPRQLLQSVPYASKLANGSATPGQVYTFDTNFGWGPADPVNLSPWTVTGSTVSYNGSAEITGATSVNSGNGGLSVGNTAGSHMTIDGDDIQRRVNGSNDPGAMYLNFYGGDLVLGSSTYKTTVRGNVNQPLSQNGIMKYMVNVDCKATPTVKRYYNGVNSAAITVSAGSGSGSCVVNFPTDLDTRYWQVSAVYSSSFATPGARNATCRMLHFTTDKDKLRCERYITTDGSLAGGEIMILIY